MEVLIVSKTHMANAACVGGLVLDNNRYVRLLSPGDYNQPTNTEFEVGQIYNLTFVDRANIHEPHIEDVIVVSKTLVDQVDDMAAFLIARGVVDWRGHIDNLFDGLLAWTPNGTGYIPLGGQMPSRSVGFWVTDSDVSRYSYEGKTRYRYPNGYNYRNIRFVGYQEEVNVIPGGTLCRVSLSRVFPPEGSAIQTPRGYYLQLSGWYNN